MSQQAEPIERMTAELAKLPGIGRKSAQRLAYFLASQPLEMVEDLTRGILQGREAIRLCERCGNYTSEALCAVCADPRRRQDLLCVVRDPRDVAAMERMHDYHGLFTMCCTASCPRWTGWARRISASGSCLLALRRGGAGADPGHQPGHRGEATAAYIARLVRPQSIRVTRIAHGVPVGSDLE